MPVYNRNRELGVGQAHVNKESEKSEMGLLYQKHARCTTQSQIMVGSSMIIVDFGRHYGQRYYHNLPFMNGFW